MHEIIPGILEASWPEIEKKLVAVRSFAKTVHVDLIDGVFAKNTTFQDPEAFLPFADDLFLEVHMMVAEPIEYLDRWAKAGFRRFLGHIEKMSDQAAFVAKAERWGEVGLALDGPTPITQIKVPLVDLDCLLIYTSDKVGFSGPPFLEKRLAKIKEIREQTDTLPIEVDGGITDNSLPKALASGATRFVSTSFLFRAENPETQYAKLTELLTDEEKEDYSPAS